MEFQWFTYGFIECCFTDICDYGFQPVEEEEDETMQLCPCCAQCCPAVRTIPPSCDAARRKESSAAAAEWCKLGLRWLLWVPAFPFVVLFSWTIPDCSKDHNRYM